MSWEYFTFAYLTFGWLKWNSIIEQIWFSDLITYQTARNLIRSINLNVWKNMKAYKMFDTSVCVRVLECWQNIFFLHFGLCPWIRKQKPYLRLTFQSNFTFDGIWSIFNFRPMYDSQNHWFWFDAMKITKWILAYVCWLVCRFSIHWKSDESEMRNKKMCAMFKSSNTNAHIVWWTEACDGAIKTPFQTHKTSVNELNIYSHLFMMVFKKKNCTWEHECSLWHLCQTHFHTHREPHIPLTERLMMLIWYL